MPERENKTKDEYLPIDRETFVKTFFPLDRVDVPIFSVAVDLTFGFIKGKNKHRVHIVRVSWEDNDSIVGFDTRGTKHVVYGENISPVEILRGYHNGNIRTSLFNHLSSRFERLKKLFA